MVERGEVLGQNEDFIYLFISISFALCLVPEFAGRSKKEEREEVIMSLHKQPFRARQASGLGLPSGGGEVRPVDTEYA